MTNALIVVDVQNDFVEGGTIPVPGGIAAARRISAYLADHHDEYSKVIASLDWHVDPGTHWSDDPDYVRSWPEHCEAFSHGARLVLDLDTTYLTHRVLKGGRSAAYSAFDGSTEDGQTLRRLLHGVTHVDVVGIAFEYCVAATAIQAVALGYPTRIIGSLVAFLTDDSALETYYRLLSAGVQVDLT